MLWSQTRLERFFCAALAYPFPGLSPALLPPTLHAQVVSYLLAQGADPMVKDNFGNTAMFEAVREGHDECVRLLLDAGATLGVDGIMLAAQMCTYIFERDLVSEARM